MDGGEGRVRREVRVAIIPPFCRFVGGRGGLFQLFHFFIAKADSMKVLSGLKAGAYTPLMGHKELHLWSTLYRT